MKKQTRRQRMLPVLGCLALLGGGTALAKEPAARVFDKPVLPVVTLQAGMHQVTAEVAATPEARQMGLMHRPALGEFSGMLFAFPDDALHCFWMKDTRIPLSVAFLDGEGTIVTITEMEPFSLASHCPEKPVRYALEMNQGWFAARGVAEGQTIGGLADVPAAKR